MTSQNSLVYMKRIGMVVVAFFTLMSITYQSSAQVRGLSYTIAPYGEYNFYGEKSGLKDGFTVGGMLGIGFGEFVELRGLYGTALNLTTDLNRFGFSPSDNQVEGYNPKDVTLHRYGGELKLNLSKGALLPYLTVGTGIQELGRESSETGKSIYLSGGLGIKFSAGDRYTIGLQGTNTRYTYSAAKSLMSSEERLMYGLEDDLERENISNWALRASLIVYIGGRKPGQITDIDKAYMDNFSGGFRGLNVPLELQVSKMDFHEDLPYRNTWMAGASAGFNFGPLVGVRGFYLRGLEEDSYTKFDEIAMYGGEARFKLNEGRGFTPWITIGGGNIWVSDEYVGKSSHVGGIDKNKGFATGGLGIDIPFGKHIKVTGFVKSILTSSQPLDEGAPKPDEILYSMNYGASVNFILGKSKKKIDVVKQSAFDEYILNTEEENAKATEELKNQYEDQIKMLEAQLAQAIAEQDEKAIKEISEDKEKAEQIVDQLDKVYEERYVPARRYEEAPKSGINMTPAEFNLLIQDIINGVKQSNNSYQQLPPAPKQGQDVQAAIADFKNEQQIENLTKSFAELSKTLQGFMDATTGDVSALRKEVEDTRREIELLKAINIQRAINSQKETNTQKATENSVSRETDISNPRFFDEQMLRKDIDRTNDKIDELREMIIEMKAENAKANASQKVIADTVIVTNPTNVSNVKVIKTGSEYDNSKGFLSKFRYNGMSGFMGINLGAQTTFNIGYRVHYGIDKTDFEVMPETFFGFGSPSAFGISVNGLYKLNSLKKKLNNFTPYVGLGLGFLKGGDNNNVDKVSGAWNFIIGSSLNVFAGDLYVDFTARNAFKYNQIIVGYRFPF